MNCIYLKKKISNKLCCKLDNSKLIPKDCFNCTLKRTKTAQILTKHSKRYNYIKKLESERFSLFTKELDKCYLCSNKKDNLHEVIFGKNRQNSMKYGLVLPLCLKHHQLMHKDKNLIDEYHIKAQKLFEEKYPNLSFFDIFKINYK